jgi:hypothetical protein
MAHRHGTARGSPQPCSTSERTKPCTHRIMAAMTQTPTSGAGRPRDPQLEHRVQDAACQLYGRVGRAGFSVDAVAKEARVGRRHVDVDPPTPPVRGVTPSADEVIREHRVVSALADTPVPFAAAVTTCADESVLGALFQMVEFVAGHAVRTRAELAALGDGREGPARILRCALALVQLLAVLRDATLILAVEMQQRGEDDVGQPGLVVTGVRSLFPKVLPDKRIGVPIIGSSNRQARSANSTSSKPRSDMAPRQPISTKVSRATVKHPPGTTPTSLAPAADEVTHR